MKYENTQTFWESQSRERSLCPPEALYKEWMTVVVQQIRGRERVKLTLLTLPLLIINIHFI